MRNMTRSKSNELSAAIPNCPPPSCACPWSTALETCFIAFIQNSGPCSMAAPRSSLSKPNPNGSPAAAMSRTSRKQFASPQHQRRPLAGSTTSLIPIPSPKRNGHTRSLNRPLERPSHSSPKRGTAAAGNHLQHLFMDSSRIRNELGYSEFVPLDEAIRRTVEWEKANPPEDAATP